MSDQYFIDPIAGDDANDGLYEHTAKASIAGALEASYLYVDVNGFYNIDPPHTIVLYLMRGACICPRVRLFHHSVDSQCYLGIHGANGAQLIFAAGDYISNSWSPSGFMLTPSGIRLDNVRVSGDYPDFFYCELANVPPVQLNNCTFRGFERICVRDGIGTFYTGLSQVTNVTTEGAFDARFPLTNSVVEGVPGESLRELGTTSWVASNLETSLGRGAFLPQPNFQNINIAAQVDLPYELNTASSTSLPFLGPLPAPYHELSVSWIDDATFIGGRPNIGTSSIQIASGDACRVISPVYYYGRPAYGGKPQITVPFRFDRTTIIAQESDTPPAGSKEVIDTSLGDGERTIEFRYVGPGIQLNQTDVSPAWSEISRNHGSQPQNPANTIGAFQYRITLRNNGDV